MFNGQYLQVDVADEFKHSKNLTFKRPVANYMFESHKYEDMNNVTLKINHDHKPQFYRRKLRILCCVYQQNNRFSISCGDNNQLFIENAKYYGYERLK